jgi:hypothetical protein
MAQELGSRARRAIARAPELRVTSKFAVDGWKMMGAI